jgi:hypothetical protein
MNYYLLTVMAAEQTRERLRTAEHSRLAALARCCQPTAWARALRRITAIKAPARRPRFRSLTACC